MNSAIDIGMDDPLLQFENRNNIRTGAVLC